LTFKLIIVVGISVSLAQDRPTESDDEPRAVFAMGNEVRTYGGIGWAVNGGAPEPEHRSGSDSGRSSRRR
jgi:hypothetical protein